MRSISTGLFAAAILISMIQPSAAQRILTFEPLAMDPYSTVYVDNGSCSAGKVLKVQGAPAHQRRKKSCVPLSDLRVPGAARAR